LVIVFFPHWFSCTKHRTAYFPPELFILISGKHRSNRAHWFHHTKKLITGKHTQRPLSNSRKKIETKTIPFNRFVKWPETKSWKNFTRKYRIKSNNTLLSQIEKLNNVVRASVIKSKSNLPFPHQPQPKQQEQRCVIEYLCSK
jgi:hypothetical protein